MQGKGDYLRGHGIAWETCQNAGIAVRELAMEILRRNDVLWKEEENVGHHSGAGERILAECSIHILNGEVELLFRDNSMQGVVNHVEQMGSIPEEIPVLKTVTSHYEYILTTSFNKYRLVIPIEDEDR